MNAPLSLRARLTLIILLPLLAIAGLTGVWQLTNAQRTAAEVFDRSLLSAALAVANDVTISGGDALSPRTRQLLADTSGGLVYYHVYAPDGVIVAGYATPPVGIPRPDRPLAEPRYFQAVYLGRPVSGVRLQSRAQIDGFSGTFTTTVWQDTAVRASFVRDLVMRSLIVISGMILSVALVVWFGVRLGLRPLVDLQQAIERRSSDELSPIARPVPAEARGIVVTLNRLFAQVSKSLEARSAFIGNAAHQLRNPIAGVLSLAEAVAAAPDHREAKRRAADLLQAARMTAELSQKLLALERAEAISPVSLHPSVDLGAQLRDWADDLAAAAGPEAALEMRVSDDLGVIACDPTMLREALINLVDNARRHGGPALSRIVVSAERSSAGVALTVRDDGRGMAQADIPRAIERFSQLAGGPGSGLGLPIVAAIAAGHGGAMSVAALSPGLEVTLSLPVGDDPPR